MLARLAFGVCIVCITILDSISQQGLSILEYYYNTMLKKQEEQRLIKKIDRERCCLLLREIGNIVFENGVNCLFIV